MKTKDCLSSLFKHFQQSIKKRDTFDDGKSRLLEFRADLWEIYEFIFKNLSPEEFSKMPLSGEKTIGYYLWHLNRIEDITSNTLILDKAQIFYENGFQTKINSPISTTGNELKREELVGFSQKLDTAQLEKYARAVFDNTDSLIRNITFDQSKIKIDAQKKQKLLELGCVSDDPDAFWLIDYWCGKDYAGLMLMPFSRHQFMHLGNCVKIMNKLGKKIPWKN